LIPALVDKFAEIAPELDLFVVSEFQPRTGRWIPYRVDRPFSENFARVRAALRGLHVRFAAIMLEPKAPYRALRLMALLTAPLHTLFYNTTLNHFALHPRSVPNIARHFGWRLREQIVFQTRPGGDLYTWLWRLRHPSQLRRPIGLVCARIAGSIAARRKTTVVPAPPAATSLPDGISVVIPSRNGRDLLDRLLPLIHGKADEIIVIDNGSDDFTSDWLSREYPAVRVEFNLEPLSFAAAVNRGIHAASYSHVCLLNNDMAPEPDFFPALRRAFDSVPGLFCATAQIFFREGKRREETGKAVMRPPARHRRTTEFPVHCVEPLPGEDLTWVLYGSGGCSLYDTAKLRAIGGICEAYAPAYVEDLDAGVRGWQRGWPSVFAAGARTVHDHRTTTSRYYDEAELSRVLERNYLLFLARTVSSPGLFRRMWRDAITRLNLKAALEHDAAAADVLAEAWRAPLWVKPGWDTAAHEESVFAIGSGDVAVFPGLAERQAATVVVASCYIPFPLSHGGAVRMYNLMRRAAADHTQILITFVDELHTPPAELLQICAEVIQVRRLGSHVRPNTGRPDVVEEFDSPAFRAALKQTIAKWAPEIVQLEFTQMAQYAADCSPAKTVLVEHDVTIDLYRQLLSLNDDWDLRRQLQRWTEFETDAWRNVDCVVTMSEKDQQSIQGANQVVTLANGVALERFRPAGQEPEPNRLLFIGSFAHLPNVLALDFFLREIWPTLGEHQPALHVIAGSKHRYHFDRFRDRVSFRLDQPGLVIEDFVADVRPAYTRATAVIAPLLASAGTNIKIMEAMAMGKAIVSTTGGVNGLQELTPGRDVLVHDDPRQFAASIVRLFSEPDYRKSIEREARATAARVYDWDVIAARQRELYESMREQRQLVAKQ
jgi:GT2 family glycosyltransferase/glycosyltransferase involved in cell wall biosynthesis